MNRIVATSKSLERLRAQLEAKQSLGVLFVDLVGSTALKHPISQQEWLPTVASFFIQVSEIIRANGGEVVKYVGDEVMAVFQQADVDLPALRMEACVYSIADQLRQREPRLEAKFALDLGLAAQVDFDGFPRDYLGTVIDRCARISKLTKSGTARSSADYVRNSRNPKSWRRVASVKLKGFPAKETVYQLRELGDSISCEEVYYASLTSTELTKKIQELTNQLKSCMSELNVHLRK